jgi:hypothetical protein
MLWLRGLSCGGAAGGPARGSQDSRAQSPATWEAQVAIHDAERRRVRARLSRGESVELDWGLVITPPKDPSAPGTSGCYRWTFYDPPVREDGTRGDRRFRVARALDDRTWLRIEEDLDTLEVAVGGRAPTRLDATFGELAAHWLEPTRHPDWSEGYGKKVASTTTNWLLADHITVEVGRNGRTAHLPLAAVRLEDLTSAMAIDALAHVRRHRAHGTTIKWIPVGHLEISDIKRAPDPRVGARRSGGRGNLGAIPKEVAPATPPSNAQPAARWRPHDRVDHQHHQNRHRLDDLAHSEPDDPRTQQQDHHRARQLPPQQPPQRDPTRGVTELIAAMDPAATYHLRLGQADRGVHPEPRKHLVGRKRMWRGNIDVEAFGRPATRTRHAPKSRPRPPAALRPSRPSLIAPRSSARWQGRPALAVAASAGEPGSGVTTPRS